VSESRLQRGRSLRRAQRQDRPGRARTGLARRHLCRRSALSRRCSVHYHYHLTPAQSSAQTLRCRDAAASGSGGSGSLSLVRCSVVVLLQLAFPADRVHGSRLGQLRLHATATATATAAISSSPRSLSITRAGNKQPPQSPSRYPELSRQRLTRV
jgi:hypothetical protein